MSTILARPHTAPAAETTRVAGIAVAIAVAAALLAGAAPVAFSIATVFLFAGPHNWIEARYFLARLPSRWGRSRAFFALSLGGALSLAVAYAAVPSLARGMALEEGGWAIAVASWNTAVVFWIVAVCRVHARQTGREWGWTISAGLALVSLTWIAPYAWSLALVFLHPLVSLAFLDRELRRRPAWRAGYRLALAAVPVVLLVLWALLATSSPIPGDDGLTLRITAHAGATIVPGVSSRLLVATHVFLETLHYGVWLVAMPLVGFRVSVLRFDAVPLGRRSPRWRGVVRAVLVAGAGAVVVLWCGFLADYSTTRDVYFTLAVAHVLVEGPFLVRLL